MSWLRWVGLLTIMAGLWGGARPAAAQTIIGNLPGNDAVNSGINAGIHYGAAFNMGAAAYTLTGATLRMNPGAGSMPIVELRAQNGGPGAVLLTFTNPTFTPGSLQEYTFLPPSPFTLEANTTYWLYARGGNATAWTWTSSAPPVTPTGPGATFGGEVFTADGGAQHFSIGTAHSLAILGTPVVAEDSPAVPEPGAVALFLPALGVVLCLKRRRAP